MSKLIKVGGRVLNLANIIEVYMPAEADGVRVNFSGGGRQDFDGEAAAALRHYFTGQALDVEADYKHFLEAQAQTRKYADWDKKCELFLAGSYLSAGEKRDYINFLYCDGDYNEPTEEGLAEWLAERTVIDF